MARLVKTMKARVFRADGTEIDFPEDPPRLTGPAPWIDLLGLGRFHYTETRGKYLIYKEVP